MGVQTALRKLKESISQHSRTQMLSANLRRFTMF